MTRDDAKEFDSVRQDEGDVFITCEPDDTIVVPREDTIKLLIVVLAAIRIEGNAEKLDIAAKVCKSQLGSRLR